MKVKLLWGCAVILLSFVVIAFGRQSPSEKDAERYIIESERQWAEAVASGDTAVAERILADDYVGVDPDGGLDDKSQVLAFTRESPKMFISDHVNEVKVRFYGDAAVAQGNESWVRRTGTPLRGRFVWTDTWIHRNGKWQIVAAQDTIAAEPGK